MDIAQHYDDIARCNRCGFCQVACPVFRANGYEAGVARGRVALLRALIEGRVPWDAGLEDPLFNCLLCGACTANCFPAVATADLMLEARREYLDRVGRSQLHRLLFRRLLPYPRRLRLAARAAAFAKKTGLSQVAKALGLLRILGRDFPQAEEIVRRFPDRAFRDEVAPGPLAGTGDLTIGYFVGCGTDILFPHGAAATVGHLRRMAKTVHVLANCCCGLPPMTYGDRTAARELAEKNLQLFAAGPFDLVVTDCSSCAAFLKKYPTLFPEDDPRRQTALAHAGRVRDLVELLPRGAAGPPAPPDEKTIATYHDPCHAVRGQQLVGQPREFLRSLSGVEYRELPEADWCCGGAGSFALTHYDLARKILDRKIDNVERTGANLLVTSCPACVLHLRYGIEKRALPVRVCHIAELVSTAAAAVPEEPAGSPGPAAAHGS
jgi:glycolate oxidase iron-sulfur subunit